MATLLLALDGSPFAERALPLAVARCGADDKLVLVRVATQDESFNYVDAHLAEQDVQTARLYLEGLAAPLRARGLRVHTLVPVGSPRDEILACARDEHADLLVMCSHGRTGWRRMLLGSVTESVAREALCPVWISHGQEPPPGPVTKALVALDLSPLADKALDFAREWLRPGVELVLFCAGDALAHLEERAAPLRAAGWKVACREGSGSPAQAIVAAAQEEGVGLIVITSRGRTGLQRMLLGSVAEEVLRHACCPVALIPVGR